MYHPLQLSTTRAFDHRIETPKWGFPEIGLLPNHPLIAGFFLEMNHPFLGVPHGYGNPLRSRPRLQRVHPVVLVRVALPRDPGVHLGGFLAQRQVGFGEGGEPRKRRGQQQWF